MFSCAFAPINGMPHLAYLGQMFKKRRGFVLRNFTNGLVLSWDCLNPLKLDIFFHCV